jgi:membrane protein implicated in regulation of membrane protease activity
MNLPDGFEAWAAWLALAIALGVLELFSLDLVLLMLAAGALVGMVASLAGLAVWVQVLAAAVASIAALGVLRPNVVKRLHSGPNLVLGHEAISSQGGQIKVGGEVWTARPYDEDQVIPVGTKVDVFQIKGATALVHPVPELG